MEVRKDFAKRVAALSSSTPREAIANLLSALMPRVAAKTRAPQHPMGGDYAEPRSLSGLTADEILAKRDAGETPPPRPKVGQPDPFGKLTRGRVVRKPLPTGRLAWVRPTNPKKGKSAERFANYYNMMDSTASTIVRLTSITAADIAWDVDHGFVRFE